MTTFSQFASDLDEATQQQLKHGQYTTELLKQTQFSPLSVALMAVSLFIIDQKMVDDIPLDKLGQFESKLHQFIKTQHQDFYDQLNSKPELTSDVKSKLTELVTSFKQQTSF